MKHSYFLTFFLVFLGSQLMAQKGQAPFLPHKTHEHTLQEVDGFSEIVCYASEYSKDLKIPRRRPDLNNARVKTSTINVEYFGFESIPEARDAFQYAIDLWEFELKSDVPINLTAVWDTDLETGVLGSARPGNFIINPADDLTPEYNLIYPIALAEKLAREPLNADDEIDILARFNANRSDWYFGTDQNGPSNQFDFVTVVLHEIGHGLGFTGAVNSQGTALGLDIGGGQFINFAWESNYFVKTSGDNLINDIQNNSQDMQAAITGDDLFFINDLRDIKMYAPGTFEQGQSVFHLDESLSNGSDALMTPFIDLGETIHDPGVALEMLEDIGWSFAWINHDPILGFEDVNTDIEVVATITSDEAIVQDQVFIDYEWIPDFNDPNTRETGRVQMTKTANPGEYIGYIPSVGTPTAYFYYIEAFDVSGRSYTNPGKPEEIISIPGIDVNGYLFQTGTDEFPPDIDHEPLSYVTDDYTGVNIFSQIDDFNTGLDSAHVEYSINGIPQTPKTLERVLGDASQGLYLTTIDFAGLSAGDEISYRIVAVDRAVAQNTTLSPPSGDYGFSIIAEKAAVEEYSNNFNEPSDADDILTSSFTVSTPTGFSNGVLHTPNPYEAGGESLYYLATLDQPIKVKSTSEAILKFDEVVLVEPGSSEGFWDFVVVEATKDAGNTWFEVLDPYDSNNESIWLDAWSANNVDGDGNSTVDGNSTFFIPRSINLTSSDSISEGDEIVLRFKLFSDPFVVGWGWAIDNLEIQSIDPSIDHFPVTYVSSNFNSVDFNANVIGGSSGIDSVYVEYSVNGGSKTSLKMNNAGANDFSGSLDLSGLNEGDVVTYTIKAVVLSGKTAVSPASGEYSFEISAVRAAVDGLLLDLNAGTSINDFAVNGFEVSTPGGFDNSNLHNTLPYSIGSNTLYYVAVLKTPITLKSAEEAEMRYKEVTLVEPGNSSELKDYVVVEGSKDGGVTWTMLTDKYDARADIDWRDTWGLSIDPDGNSLTLGSPALYKRRLVNLVSPSELSEGDEILLRFTLFSDNTSSGWGWAIDDLDIQTGITGIEELLAEGGVNIYPNPSNDLINIELQLDRSISKGLVRVYNVLGKPVSIKELSISGNQVTETIDLSGNSAGIYLLNIELDGETFTQRIVKK